MRAPTLPFHSSPPVLGATSQRSKPITRRPLLASISRRWQVSGNVSPPGTGVPVCGQCSLVRPSMSKETYTSRGSAAMMSLHTLVQVAPSNWRWRMCWS